MSIKRQNIFIRLWWKISNKFVRRRKSLLDEKDFQNFIEKGKEDENN